MFKAFTMLFLCITLFFSLNVFAETLDDMFKEMQEHTRQQEAQDQENARSAEIAQRQAITQANNNNIVYLIVLAMPIILLVRNIFKTQQNTDLNPDQKLGIKIILISGLMLVFAVMLSQPWVPQVDIMQNIFGYLRLQFFPEDDGYCSPGQLDCYTVDIPTKLIVLVLVCIGSYGFTTYLGVTTPNRSQAPNSEN